MTTTRSTPLRGQPCGSCTAAPTLRRGPPPSAATTTARSGPRPPNSRPVESPSPKPSSAGPSPASCPPHCRRSSSGPAHCAGRPLAATRTAAATGASSSARRRRARRPRDQLRAPPTRRTPPAATSTEAATTTDAPAPGRTATVNGRFRILDPERGDVLPEVNLADKALSAAFVRSAHPGRHADGTGPYLFVQPAGTRSWVQLVIRGRSRELRLGATALVTLAEARELVPTIPAGNLRDVNLAIRSGLPLASQSSPRRLRRRIDWRRPDRSDPFGEPTSVEAAPSGRIHQ